LLLASCQALSNSFTACLSRPRCYAMLHGPRVSNTSFLSLPTPRVASVRSARFHLSTYRWSEPRLASPWLSSTIRPSCAETFSLAVMTARSVCRMRAWPGCRWVEPPQL
jgi:hypothetical protein